MTQQTLLKIEAACQVASVTVEYLGYCVIIGAICVLWVIT